MQGGNVKTLSTRYVGVIRFLFHVLHILPIRFTEQNLSCIRKSTMKHMQELD